MWNVIKMIQKDLFIKRKQVTHFEIKLTINIEETMGAGGTNQGMRITHTHHCVTQIISKGLLHSPGKSIQQFIITYMGEKNGYMYMFINDLL